jgi:hypothetical protein
VWPYSGDPNQQWKLEPVEGGYYKIVARHSGKVLDVAGASLAEGAIVHQWTYASDHNQQWKIEPVPGAGRLPATGTASNAGERELRLYPNPARGQLYLRLPARVREPAALSLTDARGHVGQRQTVTAGQNRAARVDVSRLPAGLYLLRIRQGGSVATRKVVVSR